MLNQERGIWEHICGKSEKVLILNLLAWGAACSWVRVVGHLVGNNKAIWLGHRDDHTIRLVCDLRIQIHTYVITSASANPGYHARINDEQTQLLRALQPDHSDFYMLDLHVSPSDATWAAKPIAKTKPGRIKHRPNKADQDGVATSGANVAAKRDRKPSSSAQVKPRRLEQPMRPPQQGRAGSSGQLERPSEVEQAGADNSSCGANPTLELKNHAHHP